jgi:hypothetical protein
MQKYLDSNLYCGWFDGGEERIIVASANYTINANAWNKLIFDYDTTGALEHMYLNGVLIGTRSAALTTPDLSAQTLHVGNSRSGSEDARADMAHVGVWSRVLSSADRALFESGGVPSGYLSYWSMARDLKDSAAAARDLTGVNTALAAGDPNYTVSRNATRGTTRGPASRRGLNHGCPAPQVQHRHRRRDAHPRARHQSRCAGLRALGRLDTGNWRREAQQGQRRRSEHHDAPRVHERCVGIPTHRRRAILQNAHHQSGGRGDESG